MSKGAGRLERAVIAAFRHDVTTAQLCRAAYPNVDVIEKKHRVAVLQVIHRLMVTPPRPLEDRVWMIKPGSQRGHWEPMYCPGRTLRSDVLATAYHEAGHALVCLYFGRKIHSVWVHTNPYLAKKGSLGEVRYTDPWRRHPLDYISVEQELMCLFAGPIAEAHYAKRWPLIQRGVSQYYASFLPVTTTNDGSPSDAKWIGDILDTYYQLAPAEHGMQAQQRAQALIRSEPGWRFIELAADALLKMKHGAFGHRKAASLFRTAFGRPMPDASAWSRRSPTLAQLRIGWLPDPEPDATQDAA
jgi:hypothetical protein